MSKISRHPYIRSGILKPEFVTGVTVSSPSNSPHTYSTAHIDCQKLTQADLAALVTNLPIGATISYFEFMRKEMQEVDDYSGLYMEAKLSLTGFNSSGGNHGRSRTSKAIGTPELIESIWDNTDRSGSYIHIRAPLERSTRQSAP
ncbi:MAG: hypothetical protein AB8B94_09890 [Hyphomicrobiales bacterium]